MGKRILIKSGVITAFDGDQKVPGVEFIQLSKTRVSRIVPTNKLLKITFNLLRSVFTESSGISQWTRTWQCQWVVVIDGTEHACFWNRVSAIEFEKDLIYRMGRFN